jgi:hypothetical protein
MKQLFGFIDETGVLSNDPQQRFFALGILKLSNTSKLFESIKKLKDKYKKSKGFEFKFTGIKKDSDLNIHKELIDICFSYPMFSFACIVIDKQNPSHKVNTSTWDMQLTLSKKHIKSSVKESEKITIIADYLSKPNSSDKYFEDELQKLKKVFNACMIESDSSVFVQIVDILIGCIVYSYKIEHGLSATKTTPKGKLVEYIENKLLVAFQNHNKSSGTFRHKNKLCGGFTIFEPFYFNVYEKK